MPVDQELRACALSLYEDPLEYARAYRRRVEDVRFYVELAKKIGGPVLELGVGSGRVAFELARAGLSVTGVDHSRPMLAALERRLATQPEATKRNVAFCFGDIRKKRIGKRFPLVLAPFNVVLHLYTRKDVEGFLGTVRAHLAPRGLFVADLSVPSLGDLRRTPEKPLRAPPRIDPRTGERASVTETFDYDYKRQILFVTTEIAQRNAPVRVVPLAHRQFFPQEWESLLWYNGFRLVETFGDFSRGPFSSESDVMITVCCSATGRGAS